MIQLVEGMHAPEFAGATQNGETISLSDFKGKKLILYFYPKDNTPGCTAESCNLSDNYEFWREKGYDVIGVSPDSETSHQKFIQKYELKFNLIADTSKEILQAYGVWGEKVNYGKTYMGVIRTTYVINEDGIIEKIFRKVDTKEHTNQIVKDLLIK
ncbi:MAG: thioredoxin-dependent thiol peroxidase [Mariniphaga sp.]